MANDANLAVRVSVLEVQMATVAADVAEIRANYVTKAYLDERLAAFKAELDARLNTFVTKDEFREELSKLEQRLHTWVLNMFIKMFLALFFSLAGLQIAMFQIFLHK
ncbi:MAG: hypothetical protein ACEQSK_08335 [Sphingomonadaceae bacterium]